MRRRASFCQVAALVVVAHGVYACGDSGGTSANNDGTASASGSTSGSNGGAKADGPPGTTVGGASSPRSRASGSGGEPSSNATRASAGGAGSTRDDGTGGRSGQASAPDTETGKTGGSGGVGSPNTRIADVGGSMGRGGSGRQSVTSAAAQGGAKSSEGTLSGTGGRSKPVETSSVGGRSSSETKPSDSSSPNETSSNGCGATDQLKSGRASIDVSGTKREYILKLPEGYDSTQPYKLIFAFHWKGGSANDVATGNTGGGPYYGLERHASGKAIFVAPQGIDAGFANTNGRDIALVRALLELFESKLCIDPTRIFSTGFSYGGMMSDSIGCELADVFRAIAPMSGGIPNEQHPYSGCNQVNDHPIAVWMAHGDNDTVVPITAGKAALEIFVKRNQCKAQTSPVTPSPCVAYEGCATGYPVHWCQFSGGHGAPDFASAAIWSFFNQF